MLHDCNGFLMVYKSYYGMVAGRERIMDQIRGRNFAADHFVPRRFFPAKLTAISVHNPPITDFLISSVFSTIAFMPFLMWFLANQVYFGSTYLSYSGKN